VKSDTHNWFGRSALNCRLTRSSGHGAFVSGTVVCMTLPRVAPYRPRRTLARAADLYVRRQTNTPMLIESAFSVLPEVVAGLGFQKVKREANAVGSFSFALLNALHSKNILDPIRRIQMEKHYASQAVPLPPAGNNRHCDVFLDYGGSKIGSSSLANYGWRYRNYVEAKFLHSYGQTASGQDTRSSTNSAEIVADLLRLVALVPEPDAAINAANAKTATARYFLCVSDLAPSKFVNQYLTSLHATLATPPKSGALSFDLTTGKASGAFAAKVGRGFNALNLQISHITCFAHFPLVVPHPEALWLLLIRIDAASITMTNGTALNSYAIGLDRSLTQGAPGDYVAIRNFIATNIN
jgi:hypothetical protein